MTDFTQLPDDELFKIAGTNPQAELVLATMREAESGGNYNAPGGSGERGAYQFMPDTWDRWSKQYTKETLGTPKRLLMTKDNQDSVARFAVNSLIEKGHGPAEIFSIWNSGSPKWEGKVGVNAAGQKYDVPGHVNRSLSIYERLMNAISPSSAQAAEIPQQQIAMPPAAQRYAQAQQEPDLESMSDEELQGVVGEPQPQQQALDMQSMSDEELGKVAGIDFKSMSDEELAKVAGVELPTAASTKPAELKSAIPETAPEWAKNNPSVYWKIVDGIKATEIAGDVGALTAGGKVGVAAGAVGGPILALLGGVAGAGLAYSMKEQGMDRLKEYLGMKQPAGLVDTAGKAATDVAKGAEIEMGGQALGAVAGKAVDIAAPAVKSVWGSLTGAGRGAIEEAIESGKASTASWKHPFKSVTDFDRAMRGKMGGQEIVQNTKDALQIVKDKRGAEYQAQLQQIAQNQNPIDTRPAWNDIKNLMDRYNVKLNPNGTFDTSRIAMGKSGRNDIEDILENMQGWGSKPGDSTALGLDALKRQLDDFYSDSSQAREFVTSMRNIVKNLIVDNVPEYATMTSGYAEATKLIKDMEAGLMLRKQGMTGRVYADMTLRRLTSSMRDNFILRRDLVEALGDISGKDLMGQIAGYSMNSPIPLGAAGVGSAMVTEALLMKFISPKMWPVLIASSPRVAGEFLRLYGKAYGELSGTGPLAGRTLVDAFTRNRDQFKDFKLENVQPTTEDGNEVEQGSPESESQSFIRNPIPSPDQEPVRRPVRIGRDKTNGRIVHDYGDGEIVYAA